jgi:hypothetical protein
MGTQQLTTPLVLRGQEAVRLQRVPFNERSFDEGWLQKLIFQHPALIPFHEIEPVFSDSLPVVRELPTPAGPLDILYINPKGFLSLVETKLWRNPEARRSVVAQIIDYAKEMARWTYDDLVKAIRQAGLKSSQDPLVEMMKQIAGEDFEEQRFIDQVSKNLRLGRSLLLIVGDGIQEGVEQMASFLQQAPQLGYQLALLEIGIYREQPGKDDLLFVQPRLLARTYEIPRAVVEIKVPVQLSDIEVTLRPEPGPEKAGRRRITEEEFFEELNKSANTEAVEFAKWVLDNAEDHGLEVDWRDSGPVLKYTDPELGTFFNFGQLRRNGMLAIDYLYWRFKELGLPLEICRKFLEEVAFLIPQASPQRFTTKSGKETGEWIVYGKNPRSGDFPPFAPLNSKREEFMGAIDKAIGEIQKLGET